MAQSIRFSDHAIERMILRFMPGSSAKEAEHVLFASWEKGRPSRMRSPRSGEERWLLDSPRAVLVCVQEGGRKICKTILYAEKFLCDDAVEEEEDANRSPFEGLGGSVTLSVSIDYVRKLSSSHEEVVAHLIERVNNFLDHNVGTRVCSVQDTVTVRTSSSP